MIFNYKVSKQMREILLADKTGTLDCESLDAKRRVFFQDGLLIGSRSSREDELLGSVLVAKRAITSEQLAQATDLIRTGKKMGQILMELGFLTSNDVVRFVRIQIVDIACNMLFTAPNRLVFTEGVDVDPVTSISILDVFMEAAQRIPETQYYRGNLLTDASILRVAKDELTGMRAASLSPDEAEVFELVHEEKPTGEILASSMLPEDDTIRILIGLLQAGLIERQEEASPRPAAVSTPTATPKSTPTATSTPIPTQSPKPAPDDPVPPKDDPFLREVEQAAAQTSELNNWAVLGLPSGASAEDIRRAFQERSARFHPDRHPQIKDEKTRKALSQIVARASEAFNALTAAANEAKRAKADSGSSAPSGDDRSVADRGGSGGTEGESSTPKDPARAKEFFSRAKKAFSISDYWEAIEMCRLAIDYSGDEAEHFHLLGLALGQNSRWRKDAENNLKIATKLKPWEPKYFVSLAELYQREGLHLRAQRTIEQILAIDPTHKLPESLTDGGGSSKSSGKKKASAKTVETA